MATTFSAPSCILLATVNFNPELRPWHIIAKYWPVIIIFWGLSKLFDYIQATQHPESAPQRFFTGGEVLLLVAVLDAWFGPRPVLHVQPQRLRGELRRLPYGGSSITGVAFYQGGSYPTQYNGALFFADYAQGDIIPLWQNYVHYTLKNHFAVTP